MRVARLPVEVSSHAALRAMERFGGLHGLSMPEVMGLLRRVVEQGEPIAEAYIVGQLYVHAYVPGVGDMVAFVRPCRDRDGAVLVIVTSLTLDEVVGAGASDPSTYCGPIAGRTKP